MGLTQVNSEGIKDGEIKDADVNASAAIAGSKLAAATTSAAGSMSAADKTKLDGVATGATAVGGATGVDFNDDVKARFGTGNDLEIYHASSNNASYIKEGGAGNLYIFSENLRIENADGSESYIEANANGAVELYYNGAKKFETNQYGNKSLQHLYMDDSHKLQLGSSQDLQIFHDGYNRICGDDLYINNLANTEQMIACAANGAVQLFYDNSKKLHTYDEGCKVTGYIKACTDESDSHWPNDSYDWHKISNNQPGSGICVFEHSGDTNPYGLEIYFTDNTPDNNTNVYIYAADLSAARFRVYSDGDVWNHDDSYTGSDQTLKENIVDATPKLEDLKKLKVRNFNWKSEYFPNKSKKKQLGFIAQEVEEVFPALVTEHDISGGSPTDSNHTPVMKKAIKQAWSPIIIKAMQELIEKVETLETEVNTLKTKVAALEAK